MKKLVFLFFCFLQFQLLGQQITQVKLKDLEDGLNERIVNRVERDTFGFFYIFTDNFIQRYDGVEFELVEIPIDGEQGLKNIDNIIRDENGGLLISSEKSKSVLQIPPAGLKSYFLAENDEQYIEILNRAKLSFDGRPLKYVVRDRDTIVADRGSFWQYSAGKFSQLGYIDEVGLNCNSISQDNYGNIIAAYGYSPNETDSVFVLRHTGEISDYSNILGYNNKIKHIYSDDINHRCMLATFNGLFVISFKRKGIETFHEHKIASASDFGKIVMAVSADGPDVLIGDENYGLRRVDSSGDLEVLYSDYTSDFFDNEMIIFDSLNSHYYVLSNFTDYEAVIYTIDTTYSELRKQIIPFKVVDILILNDKELLLVGANVNSEDESTNGIAMVWNCSTSSGQVVINNIPHLSTIEKVGENYWVGSREGLYIYDASFVQKQTISLEGITPYVLCMSEIGNQVFVGTYGKGLFVISSENNNVVSHYTKRNFLSDNIVASLEQDNEGNIWIGTFNGINVLDQNGHIISKIMDYDGISHREMNTQAISKDKNGHLYLGTLNGLTKLNPKEVLAWSSSYGLYPKEATAYYGKNGQVINVNQMPIPVAEGFDSLLINMIFPDYVKTIFDTPINYLKLNGNNNVGISHDKKQLLLTSHNFETDQSQLLTSFAGNIRNELTFDIIADYTNELISVLVLLCILGLLSVIFYRQKASKAVSEQNEKIEINKRIAELELSALQSQMNPHFIFNALGAIQYFIQTQKTEEADNFLADFALLMRKILETSKKKYLPLREEKEILDLYVKLEQLRFEGLFDFNWHVDESVDMEMLIPPMILQPFVENAINHGLYNMKDKKGELNIHIDCKSDNIIQCIIIDNGIGRKKAGQLRNKKHRSRGMQIVNERIKTFTALNDINIEINTQDLYDHNEPMGTKVIVDIDYNRSNFSK